LNSNVSNSISPRVRVVIVTFNAEEIIADCLNSLKPDFDSGLLEVVVADNNSSDQTANLILQKFAWVELRRTGANLGFGAGNNIGAEGCRSDFLYFFNPDARNRSNSIQRLVSVLDDNRKVGIAGPLVLDEDGKPTLSTYCFITPFQAVWIALGLQHLIPFNRINGMLEIRKSPPPVQVSCDRLLGAAMLIRNDLFITLEGFDNNIFLYSEEEDLCLRCQKEGFEVKFDPSAEVTHLGSKTIVPFSVLGTASASWSLGYFLKKHYNAITSRVAIFIWVLMLIVKLIVTILFIRNNRHNRLQGYRAAILALTVPEYYERRVKPH